MRSNTNRILLITLLIWNALLGLSTNVFCRAPFSSKTDSYTQFRNISAKDGLSSDLVLNIFQDKYNIMWFATIDGLTRYDGQKFIVYRNQQESEHSLSNNLVTSITEDIYGNLWVGTLNGLNRYDRNTDRFIRYLPQSSENNGLVDGRIMTLHADKNGNLWIKYKNGFLSRFNIQAEAWSHYNLSAREFEGEYYYGHITEDSSGNLWISQRNMVMRILQQKNGNDPTIIEATFAPEVATFETSCGIETHGKIYFANYNGQLLCFDPQSKMVEYVMGLGLSARAGTCDKNGKLWIGGRLGLKVIDTYKQEETIFSSNPANPSSLVSNEIYCIYKDRNDGIWIGTDKGVSFYSEGLNTIQHFRRINGLEQGLSSNDITAILQDKDGLLWIGTAENGVDTMMLANENFGNLTYNLLTPDISKTTFDREKETLRQYFRHKYIIPLDREATEQNIFSNFQNFKNSRLRFNNVNENKASALYEDSKGDIYVGLWSHIGFNIFDKKNT